MKKGLFIALCLFTTTYAGNNPLLEISEGEFISLFTIYATDYQRCIEFWQQDHPIKPKQKEAKCETMRTNIYFLVMGFNKKTKKSIFEGGMEIFKDEKVQKRFIKLIPKNDRFLDLNDDDFYEEHF